MKQEFIIEDINKVKNTRIQGWGFDITLQDTRPWYLHNTFRDIYK